MQLHLQNPEMLWGLIPVAALGAAIWIFQKGKSRRFSYRHLVFTVTAFSLCVVGLSRPQLGSRVSKRKGNGTNVFIAVDISRSMLAEDIRPSRLQFVTSGLRLLGDALAESRVALFSFAADGYLQVPLTSDLDGLLTITPTLSPDMTTDQGTDLSQAMQTLFTRIMELREKTITRGETWFPTQVVVFSDGETHEAIRSEVFEKFRAQSIPIFTVGTGTPSGAPIPVRRFRLGAYGGPQHLKDNAGKTVYTKLQAEPLQKISELTGGEYFPGDLAALGSLGERLVRSARSGSVTTELQVAAEYYPLLFAVALVLFAIELALGRWQYAIRALLPWIVLVGGMLPISGIAEGRTDKLLAELEAITDPDSRAVMTYNLGVAYFEERNLQKAAEYFQEAAYIARDTALKKKALFNLGNAMLYQQEPEQAIGQYQRAYDQKTEDVEFDRSTNQKLSENIALAARILKQQQQSGSGQSDKQDDGKQGQQPQDSKGPKNDYKAEQFSDERKQRIFDLIAREEQETIQRLQSQNQKEGASAPNAKQW